MANLIYLTLMPCTALLFAAAYHGPDLSPGPYCGTTQECCINRQDECSRPILDTLCYCDEHCNRAHDDCCPDYEEVCLGILPTVPPERIILGPCLRGQKKTEQCNQCVCEVNELGVLDWRCEKDPCIISDEVLAAVARGGTWRAANYSDFYGRKLKDGLVYKLGTLPLTRETERMGALRYDKDIPYPTHFDARSRWPGYISAVMDQGWCGSDWAVSIVGVASDRYAIQSNGAENVILSPQTLLSCNLRGQQGCTGGHIDNAWNFVRGHGLVDDGCFPYKASVTTCPFKRRGDLISDGCTPLVQKRTSRYKVGPLGRLKVEKDIMYDIMESGPVQAIMTVYQDFFHYRSGIYRRTPYGDELMRGLHSVRVVGWGEESGEKYWIVANSWGRQWGEEGYFRIARGSNEAGIESFVVTVLSEVSEA